LSTVSVGATSVTSNVSVAVPLSGASVFVTTLDVFVYVPGTDAVTSTATVHIPDAAIVPPLNDIDTAPAAAVTVPPQSVVAFGVPATTIEPGIVGNVSSNETPVSAVPTFGFVIVNVRVETASSLIGSGVKFFVIVGARIATTSVSSLALLLPGTGSLVVALTVTLFVIVPDVPGAVTVTVIAGAAPTANVARLHVTTPAASLHVHPVPEADTYVTPAGSVSSTLTPLAVDGPLFVTLNVYVNVPPTSTGSGLSLFVIARSALAVTVRSSEAVKLSGASLLVTTDVVFVTVPAVELVTSTSTVHVPEAAILPPLKLKLVSVATGANAGVPHPVVVIPGGLATSTPAGNASVNATPVSPVPAFGFTISIVNVLVPPAAIVSATNVFVTVGARIAVTVSLSVFEVTPSTVASAVFVTNPAVTSTAKTV